MSTYPWPQTPGWVPVRFEMRVIHNDFVFTSQYSKVVQAIDLLGERWHIIMELPADNDGTLGAAREAFGNRMRGRVNLVSIGHQRRLVPLGTLRDGTTAAVWRNNAAAVATWQTSAPAAAAWTDGAPALRYALAQFDNIATLQAVPGATLRAGDMVGLGVGGQLVQVLADTAPANGAGLLVFEFTPRARKAIPAYTQVVWASPTANFRQVSDGMPVQWHPGMFEGTAIELIEDV